MPGTRDEVNELKRAWANDPCYNLEDADGFEEHHDELLAYRLRKEAEWEARHVAQVQASADKVGVDFETAKAVMREESNAKCQEEQAARLLVYYLGGRIDDDTAAEQKAIAEHIIAAAVARAKAEILPMVYKMVHRPRPQKGV